MPPDVAVAPAKALMLALPHASIHRGPRRSREALNEVRQGINRALPAGYKAGIQFGMISWFVPLSTYPAGSGGNPKKSLPLISLASKKAWAVTASEPAIGT